MRRCPSYAAAVALTGAALWIAVAQPTRGVFQGTRAGESRLIGDLRFCWAPPGTFRMGSPPDEPERRADEGPVEVTLSRGFWIGKFEVTQGQWTAVMGNFPREQDKGRGDDVAVHWVSYLEAVEFCHRLTKRARTEGSLATD